MRDKVKKSLIFGGVVFCCLLLWIAVFNQQQTSDVWVSMMLAVPDKVTPKAMSIAGYCVIKQTHEPIFRKEDGYNYTSKLLERWERSVDYKSYAFCPKTSLFFYPGKPFGPVEFVSHLQDITRNFDGDAKIELHNNCVSVVFRKPARKYLDYLCAFGNAPSVAISSNVEAGLGPFVFESMIPGKIVLKRRNRVSNGFNKIEFVNYRPGIEQQTLPVPVADYNLALSRGQLENLGDNYIHFDNMSLKSALLILDIPDKEQREMVYNCVDIDALRHAFAPKIAKFNYIQTLLPIGVPGAIPGHPRQDCDASILSKKWSRPLVLANWRTDNVPEMASFAKQFFLRTGMKINVLNVSAEKLAKLLHGKTKPYNLVIIMSTPDSDDNYRFLESYFGKNSLLRYKIDGIEGLYGVLSKSDDVSAQKDMAAKIAEKIAERNAVLPLYQTVTTVYYPKGIRNFYVGKELFEYPEVADFRW